MNHPIPALPCPTCRGMGLILRGAWGPDACPACASAAEVEWGVYLHQHAPREALGEKRPDIQDAA